MRDYRGDNRCNASLLFLELVAELFVGDQQILEHAAANDRLFDDPRHVLRLHVAVPDFLRIDDHRRAQLALIQAAGRVGSHQRCQVVPLQLFLEAIAEVLLPLGSQQPRLCPGSRELQQTKIWLVNFVMTRLLHTSPTRQRVYSSFHTSPTRQRGFFVVRPSLANMMYAAPRFVFCICGPGCFFVGQRPNLL